MQKLTAISVLLVGLLSLPLEAYAYLDPGTGSILIQGLIAAVATGLATAKFWWHRVKSFFTGESKEVQESDDGQLTDSKQD